jgi:hypothetical protein
VTQGCFVFMHLTNLLMEGLHLRMEHKTLNKLLQCN